MRKTSYGENYRMTLIDKFGIFLSQRKVVNYVKKNNPKRIIDIGCGFDALLLQSLKKYSTKLIGVDLTINNQIKGIEFIKKTISTDLKFLKDNSADLIIMNSVLEHLDEPNKILREIYRVLDKEGTLIINVPNWRGKFFLEFSAFKLKTSPSNEVDDHKMYYDKKDLWPILVSAGFAPSKIHIIYHKFFLNTLGYAKK